VVARVPMTITPPEDPQPEGDHRDGDGHGEHSKDHDGRSEDHPGRAEEHDAAEPAADEAVVEVPAGAEDAPGPEAGPTART
jgi:hypothetical protein